MFVTNRVHPREGIVKGLAHIRTEAAEAAHRPQVGLGVGLLVAALAGAPMPLPQLALLGPWIAYAGMGRAGAKASSAVGFISFALFAHASPLALAAAALIALASAWGVPAAIEGYTRETSKPQADDGGASAIMIDCEGFSSLDDSYGPGASEIVFSMLQRALKLETRDSDLVVHVQGQELVLVLDGSSPEIAQAVMERVERRFSESLVDAGYECNLSVGISGVDGEEDEFDRLMRAARPQDGPYLD